MKPNAQTIKVKLQILLLFMLSAGLIIGCSPNKVGKLIGVKATMSLSDALDGVFDNANFDPIVIVKLDNGTEVEAIWDKSLGGEVTGGMKLEIAPTDDPDFWKVIRIVETP